MRWWIGLRAHLPSARPQAWQSAQQARALARIGEDVLQVCFAPRPEGAFSLDDLPPLDPRGGGKHAVEQPPQTWGPPRRGLWFRARCAEAPARCDLALVRDDGPGPWLRAAAALRSPFPRLREWHERPAPSALHDGDLHLPVSAGFADDLRARGIPASSIEVLPNACGLDRRRATQRLTRPAPSPSVLTLGLHRRAALDLALRCWSTHRDLPILRLGGRDEGGTRTGAWARTVAEDRDLGGRITLIGPQWGAQREDAFDDAAVVLALYPDDGDCRERICPLQVVDALGSGRPVVVSDLPSIRNLVGERPVHWVRPDGSDLADAVRSALADAPDPAATTVPRWDDRALTLRAFAEHLLRIRG